jgi:protein-S-isoprenylcysteine O-methyltransferase Ste14
MAKDGQYRFAREGVPKLTLKALPVPAALALSLAFPASFAFAGKLYGLAFAAGIELAAFGLAFLASAAIELLKVRGEDGPAVRGAFALSRHPVFAWGIFSVLPALALLLNSWLFLAAALALRLIEGPAAREKEAELSERYGPEYSRYKARVRPFLPLPYLLPLSLRRWLRALPLLALMGVAAIGVFALSAVPAMGRLGATRVEASAPMPGDEYLASGGGYTQAIDIAAPAAEVWKWLVQVGYRRAGWYNIDAINRLAGKDYFRDPRGSAVRIMPELQDLKEGDKVFIVPVLGFDVVKMERDRLLLLVGDPAKKGGADNVAWCYSLTPRGEGSCRLVTRFRSSSSGGPLMGLANAIINYLGGATIQQPAMLWGLKRRAERTWRGALL